MARRARRIAVLVGGWVFLVLGVLGLFLPVLQGVLFLLVGVYLLSRESPWARLLRQKFRRRYPKIGRHMDEARDWSARQWRRLTGR